MLRASDDANEQLPIRKCVYTYYIDTTPRQNMPRKKICTPVRQVLQSASVGSSPPVAVSASESSCSHN